MMLKVAPVEKSLKDKQDPTAAQTTQLRSAIGGRMRACCARPDIMAELASLQSIVTKGKVKHLRQAQQLGIEHKQTLTQH